LIGRVSITQFIARIEAERHGREFPIDWFFRKRSSFKGTWELSSYFRLDIFGEITKNGFIERVMQEKYR
jgi:hypothetical protein